MRNSIFIKIQIVPLLKQIEYRYRVGEPHLEIRPHSLPQMFKATDLRQKRKNGFNQHSVVPLAFRTNLQIYRLIGAAAKAFVCQDNHFFADSFSQRQKLRVRDICRFHRPISNESEFVSQKAKLAADNPLPSGIAFFADAPVKTFPGFSQLAPMVNNAFFLPAAFPGKNQFFQPQGASGLLTSFEISKRMLKYLSEPTRRRL